MTFSEAQQQPVALAEPPSTSPTTTSPPDPDEIPEFSYPFLRAVDNHHITHLALFLRPHTVSRDSRSTSSPSSTTSSETSSANPTTLILDLLSTLLSGIPSTFPLSSLPARFLPFFSYKDVVLYSTPSNPSFGPLSPGHRFDAFYRAWYVSRDRAVPGTHDGIGRGPSAPFFAACINFDPGDGDALLPAMIAWHKALLDWMDKAEPAWSEMDQGPMTLVRPGRTEGFTTETGIRRIRREYTPCIRRSFREGFVWAEGELRLVVLEEGMLARIERAGEESLVRDTEMEVSVAIEALLFKRYMLLASRLGAPAQCQPMRRHR